MSRMNREEPHRSTQLVSRSSRRASLFVPALLFQILLVSTAALAAPPASPSPAPSSPATPPAATSPTSPVASNGYNLTVQYWLKLEQTARETEKVLQDLYTQTVAAIPDDTARLRTYFTQKLTEKFPGSTFNGVMGSVVLPDKLRAHFNDKFMVDRIEEVGLINVNYFLKQGQFVVSNGTNSVGGIINKDNPSQSVFTKVDIEAMRSKADKILGNRTVTANSPEEAVINDAYQLLSVTNNARMDAYAGELVVSSDAQEVALGLAERGYRQRHPGEYQGGAGAVKKPKEKDYTLPTAQSGSSRTVMRLLFIGGLFVLCALFVKLSWHFMAAGFNSLKKNSRSKRRSSRSSAKSGGSPSGSSDSHRTHKSSGSGSSRSHGSSRTHRSSRVHRSSRSGSSSRSGDPEKE